MKMTMTTMGGVDRLLSEAYVTWSHNSIDESLTMKMSNWPINWSLFSRDHSQPEFEAE